MGAAAARPLALPTRTVQAQRSIVLLASPLPLPEASLFCPFSSTPADGVDVGNDGTVPFRHGERVDFK